MKSLLENGRPEKVHIIINPAPSRRLPLLAVLNTHFRRAGIHWDVSITHGTGDGAALARAACEGGADVIGVYGGDGTVIEVASALVGSKTPLMILPGGTGNLVAAELGISRNIDRACAKVCGDILTTRDVDVGRLNDKYFLLRAGCGIESGVVQDATRDLKDQFGKWAYVFAAIKRLQEQPVAEYTIRLDDRETFRGEGVACGVANAGRVGVGKLALSPTVDMEDGKLDVFFLKKANIEGIFKLASRMVGIDEPDKVDEIPGLDASKLVNYWQVKKVEIHTDPELEVQVDGDVTTRTPINVEVVPRGLRVVV